MESLREAVARNLSVAKEHEELLEDIVEQVFLASEPYQSIEQHGFLGVMFDPDEVLPAEDPTALPYFGVEIYAVLPGLAASKCLEVGDVVMAVKVGATTYELASPQDMKKTVSSLPAGQRVTFRILRKGKMLSVEAVLCARPAGLIDAPGVIEQFTSDRQSRADDYWEQHFAPILDGRMSSPAPPAARVSAEP